MADLEVPNDSPVPRSDIDSLELNSIDIETTTSSPRPQTRLLLRTQNKLIEKPQFNPEEQIIKARGRRQLPKTPTRRSPRKRITSTANKSNNPLVPADDSSLDPSLETLEQSPICSPFTKCLRGLASPPRPNRRTSLDVSNLRKRLLMSPPSLTNFYRPNKRVHYYSPTSRSLRSYNCFEDSGFSELTDTSTTNSTNSTSSSLNLTDQFNSSAASTSSSSSQSRTSLTSTKCPSSSSSLHHRPLQSLSAASTGSSLSSGSKQGINRARRRFRF